MTLGTPENPLRVAIVGSGPSGFYAAEALFKSEHTVHVDMYEKLPVPFGLVRSGVAPDHPKIKNVTRIYDKIASNEGFRFLGNVTIGQDLTVEDLKSHYHAVLFASGASSDRRLNIPGEDLDRSYTATEFVAWYNGHPDYKDRVFDLSRENAVIIGQGNVAVDVCRILSKSVEELKATDIADHALEALAESKIKNIYMIGRRGPAQAAFTPQEAKELGELELTEVVIQPEDLELSAADEAELEMNPPKRKNVAMMRDLLAKSQAGEFADKPRKLHLMFFKSPVALEGENGSVERVILERNQLSGEAGAQKARGTGEKTALDSGIFFRSVGYRGVPMEGVPFREDWGVFHNEGGRIETGMYTAGWIKRGPSGIIGTNKPCSYDTVKALLADLSLLNCEIPSTEPLVEKLQANQVRVVSYADWKKIDAAELAAGEAKGKSRSKFTSVEDMLAVLN